jgi:hypothetical protein
VKRHIVFVACLAIGLIACSDDAKTDRAESADVAAVDATMEAVRDTLAAGDVAGFLNLWTDNGLQQLFHETSDSFETGYYVGAKQYSLGASAGTTVSGDAATTFAALYFRLVGVVRQFSLVRQDGVWKVDGGTLATADAGNAAVIDVAFGESTIEFDPSLIVDGNIALRVHNSTAQRHELNMLTALPERDITAFFEHPEDEPPVPEGRSMPEGTDFIGGVSSIDPGVTVTILFSETLPAARYVFFCNSEDDPSGTPHSKSGEFAEFTIA